MTSNATQSLNERLKRGAQRLNKLEPFLPFILALHGTLLLFIGGSSVWQWLVLGSMAALGVTALLPKKTALELLLFRAMGVLGLAWLMMYVHKGAASYFFFWMVVLVVMYSYYLPQQHARFLPLVAASSILLMGAIGHTTPTPAVLNKFLHLNIIGYLVFFLSLQVKQQFSELSLVKSELEKQEAFYRHKSNHDSLTGLPNRRFLMRYLEEGLAEAKASDTAELALIFIDIDNLKMMNDCWGHMAGDALILETVARLKSCLIPNSELARVAGDEFALIVPNVNTKQEVVELAERTKLAFVPPWSWQDQERPISVSMGITFSNESATITSLLRQADEAMYLAKNKGKARYVVFNEEALQRRGASLEL